LPVDVADLDPVILNRSTLAAPDVGPEWRTAPLQSPFAKARRWLPQGRALPDSVWTWRHTLISRFALVQAIAVTGFGLLMSQSAADLTLGLLAMGIPALLGLIKTVDRRTRSMSVTASLMFTSATVVDYAHGDTEAHFHFFVMIGVVALYQDWATFGLCVLITVLHHVVMGTLAPHTVFAGDAERSHPITWALIHGAFILAACTTHLVAWRANEQQELSDPLTRLPNRTAFSENLDMLLSDGAKPVSVLFIDLDNFKAINDSGGHHLGDLALLHATRRLLDSTRSEDMVARLGGDEFAVLISGTVDLAEAVGERIHTALQAPMVHDGREIFVRASIGVADSVQALSRDASDLLRDADLAMYLAKSAGRNRVARYTPGVDLVVKEHAGLAADIRLALSRNELRLQYQPILTDGGQRICGVEALLRWTHPVRGPISPDVFIPIAEQTGDIAPIGLWVLTEACRQVGEWQKTYAGAADLELAVNLSPVQMRDPNLILDIATIVNSSQVKPSNLTLEVTEGAILADLELANRQLGAARALGIKIAIDDFGTGYSSLSYLAKLPADQVKIDRSFINAMTEGRSGVALVKGIIDMASALALETLAEGIELSEQQSILSDLGCERSQGFLYARPLSPQDFLPFAASFALDLKAAAS
jgi:diguanylate cyclase (GGDEF)-like protein